MCSNEDANKYFHDNDDLEIEPPEAVMDLRYNMSDDTILDGTVYDLMETFKVALDAGICFAAINDEIAFALECKHEEAGLLSQGFRALNDMRSNKVSDKDNFAVRLFTGRGLGLYGPEQGSA